MAQNDGTIDFGPKWGRYDPVLSMFVREDSPEPDMNRLRYLRHLAEGDPDDGFALGPPSGPLAEAYGR
jgi:hypothetical protein